MSEDTNKDPWWFFAETWDALNKDRGFGWDTTKDRQASLSGLTDVDSK